MTWAKATHSLWTDADVTRAIERRRRTAARLAADANTGESEASASLPAAGSLAVKALKPSVQCDEGNDSE